MVDDIDAEKLHEALVSLLGLPLNSERWEILRAVREMCDARDHWEYMFTAAYQAEIAKRSKPVRQRGKGKIP